MPVFVERLALTLAEPLREIVADAERWSAEPPADALEPAYAELRGGCAQLLDVLGSPAFRNELQASTGHELGPVTVDLLQRLGNLLEATEHAARDAEPSAATRALRDALTRADHLFTALPLCGPLVAIDRAGAALLPLRTRLEAEVSGLATGARKRHDFHLLYAEIRRDERVGVWLGVLLGASAALATIESRVGYIVTRIAHVVADLAAAGEPVPEQVPLRAEIADLERLADQIASSVPADPEIRAVLARLAGLKHAAPFASIPNLRRVCGWDTPAVREAYRARFGAPLETSFPAAAAVRPRERELAHEAGWLVLRRGEVLCKEGEPGDRLYYLASGRVRVAARDAHGVERSVAEISRGEYIGEMSMLTGEARSASVYALRDSELLVLDQPTFDRIQSRETLRRLTAQVATRLRRTMRNGGKARRRVTAIAVVPASPQPLESFCRDLTSALAAHGRAAHVGSRDLIRAHLECESDADTAGLVEWLDRREMEHAFVVYEADAEATHWTKRCLLQADVILVVAAADGDAVPSAAARLVLDEVDDGTGARCDLVLLGAWSAQVRRSARLRAFGTRPSARYHVDPANRADVARLARYVTGCAVGLVLGGGAARGYAHIGVVRALKEAGVPIDLVCGVSMGAIVAAAVALDWGPDEMLDRLRIGRSVVFDPSFPMVSIARGVGFRRWLETWMGDLEIWDLRIPFFSASANLTRAELKIHTEGSLIKAVMASNAAPAMLPPVVDDGDLLVDGGLLANVPSDAMRAFVEVGPVIAVDVVPPEDLAASDDYGLGLSGLRVLANKLLPRRRRLRMPNIVEIQMRAQLLASLAQSKHAHYEPNDLHLPLPLAQFSLVDYGGLRSIAEEGYRQAAPAIARWKAAQGALL